MAMQFSDSTVPGLKALATCLIAGLAFCQSAAGHENQGTDMGAEWWQFMSSIPARDNPLLDTTGAKCVVGQRGNTWFLGGLVGVTPEGQFAQGGGTVTRNCSIPQGINLFFPIINNVIFDTPNLCGQDANSYSYAEMKSMVQSQTDAAIAMRVTVDGREVHNIRRIRARPIAITVPENSAWDAVCRAFDLGGLPAGIFPGAQDGYYLTLNALPVGQHQLRIQGALQPPNEFTLDIIYNLTVVALP